MPNPGAEPERLLATAYALRNAFAVLFDMLIETQVLPEEAIGALRRRTALMLKPLDDDAETGPQVLGARVREENEHILTMIQVARTARGAPEPGTPP